MSRLTGLSPDQIGQEVEETHQESGVLSTGPSLFLEREFSGLLCWIEEQCPEEYQTMDHNTKWDELLFVPQEDPGREAKDIQQRRKVHQLEQVKIKIENSRQGGGSDADPQDQEVETYLDGLRRLIESLETSIDDTYYKKHGEKALRPTAYVCHTCRNSVKVRGRDFVCYWCGGRILEKVRG